MDNYRVGAKIIAKNGIFYFCFNKSYITGNKYAAVFPEPVYANPIISLPFKAIGMDNDYILVGWM